MAKTSRKKSFGQRLDELSELVSELEQGDLDLEEAIERFEKGRKLHGQLLQELGRYEKRLERLERGPDGAERTESVPDDDPAGSEHT